MLVDLLNGSERGERRALGKKKKKMLSASQSKFSKLFLPLSLDRCGEEVVGGCVGMFLGMRLFTRTHTHTV